MIVPKLRRTLAAAAALTTLGCLLSPASADAPASDADITGKTVYLLPNSALRYGKSLLSRVYTRSGTVLELKGTGKCTTFNCPVTHNNVELFARRVRLDTVAPAAGAGVVADQRTLRRGDEGDDVKALQEALKAKGFDVTADGKFGRGTEEAVMDFQKRANLEADGSVGPEVRAALALSAGMAADGKPKALEKVKEAIKEKIEQIKGGKLVLTRTLRLGDEGDDVRQLQDFLNTKGYTIKVDGKYGDDTKAAVRDFQRKAGISADGNVGPLTLEKLNA